METEMADLSRSRAATGGRAIAFALTASLVVACGGAATSSPTALAVLPTGTPAATSATLPSLDLSSFQADVELEALLPDSLGGSTLTKMSVSGAQLFGAGAGSGNEDLQALLTALGKTAADVTVAFASDLDIIVAAYRIKGVDGNTFLSAYLTAALKDAGTTTTDVNIAGKSVKKITPADGDATYVYPSGDVIFAVTGAGLTDALISEAFSKLR
jgi:hypothetical protein